MSGITRRFMVAIAASAALAVPLVVSGSAGVATAATYTRTVEYRGNDVAFHAFGSAPGYPGNAHAIYLNVENDRDGTKVVGGWIWDFRCGPGETINGLGWGDEDESNCTMVRALNVAPHSVRLQQALGTVDAARITGRVQLADGSGHNVRTEPLDLELHAFGATTLTDDAVGPTLPGGFIRTFERDATVTGTFGSLTVTGAPRQEVRADIWRAVLFSPTS